MKTGLRVQLSIMMFVQFFVWGSWFVTLGTFLAENLHATGLETANIFSTQSYGAIIAPLLVGMIADKYFNAERILGILHIIGAILMYQMYTSDNVATFYPYTFAYMVAYMPTLALASSVSFRQMQNPEKEFSSIRVWGTIGWIVAGLIISYGFHWDAKEAIAQGHLKNTFAMASIASLLLGVFSFTLPKTPPVKDTSGQSKSIGSIIGLDAIKMLKNKNFLVFFVSSILICIPLAFYYQNAHSFLEQTGLENTTGKMAIGQVSEALFILLIPVLFARIGFKKTIMLGMVAWAIRYVMFAYGNADNLTFMLIIGIALHGICYDFFFVAGQIYTDARAGEKYKNAAQGLVTLATYGVGMLIGFWVAGFISDYYKANPVANVWKNTWLIPAGIALVVWLLFLAFFKEKKEDIALNTAAH